MTYIKAPIKYNAKFYDKLTIETYLWRYEGFYTCFILKIKGTNIQTLAYHII